VAGHRLARPRGEARRIPAPLRVPVVEGDAVRQVLSEARAKAVAAWLTSHGVPASRVAAKGYGKRRPVADNDSDLGRAKNRRIELVRTGC